MSRVSVLERLRSWLASPRALRDAVLAAILVALPSLGNGFAADDYWHKITLTRDEAWDELREPWWKLFTFFDGDVARNHRIIDIGISPWWTTPDLAVSFLRPVSAATHALDYALWPAHPWLMHLHSVAWYAAIVWVAGAMYRRVLERRAAPLSGGWVAGLAALLYALDHTHGIPVGWLANRNALVTGFFALASLVAHDKSAREEKRGGWTIGSAALFALALGAGEASLAVIGYFVAHALYIDTRPLRARLASFAPHVFVTGVWAIAYRAGGFGARGSGLYLEPIREPLQSIAGFAKHLPLLLATELGAPTPDLYVFLPLAGKIAFVVFALLFLAWSAVAVRRVWRVDPVARFFLVGSVLATLPGCSTVPSGRLLMVPGFGLIGLVALIGAGLADGAPWIPGAGWSRRFARSFALWSCGGHLLFSPFALVFGTQQLVVLNRTIARVGADLPRAPSPTLKRVVIMNVPDTVFAPYLFLGQSADGGNAPPRMPARLLTIAAGVRQVDLRRTDERTVIVRVDGGFYQTGTELITRDETIPMPVGTKLLLTDVMIEVLETTPAGVPTEVSFRFDEGADSVGYLWERWDGDKLVAVHPPAIGEHVTTPGRHPQLF